MRGRCGEASCKMRGRCGEARSRRDVEFGRDLPHPNIASVCGYDVTGPLSPENSAFSRFLCASNAARVTPSCDVTPVTVASGGSKLSTT